MKFETIVTGAEGEGVAALASVLSAAAIRAGFHVSHSALEAVAGRAGAVLAFVRISDVEIDAPKIASGEADLVLALEPLEAMRQREHLSPSGALISSSNALRNCDDYPPTEDLLWSLLSLKRGFLVDTAGVSRESAAPGMEAMVLAGAACDFLPMDSHAVRPSVAEAWGARGEDAVKAALAAYDAGRRVLQHREIVDEFEIVNPDWK